MKPEREDNKHTIVFGQAFRCRGRVGSYLYVVIDTDPKFNPNVISASQIVIEGNIERLGIPGGIDPSEVHNFRDVWNIERIIKAMGITLGGDLPNDMKEMLIENSRKPPRII